MLQNVVHVIIVIVEMINTYHHTESWPSDCLGC